MSRRDCPEMSPARACLIGAAIGLPMWVAIFYAGNLLAKAWGALPW